MKKIGLVLLVVIFGLSVGEVMASNIPGIQTPIPIVLNNLIGNGGFENGNANGWQFGNINRAVINNGTASEGNYFIDTTDCISCPSDFGNSKTIAHDFSKETVIGQRYSVSIDFRSPQGGTIEFVVWATDGGNQEVFSTGDKIGNNTWQKLEIPIEIKEPDHKKLRSQIYIKNAGSGIQYQFDNLILSQAGTSGNCPTSYFTYQQALKADAPTLADLFDGKAHFQNISESQIVNLQFDPTQIDTGYANGQPSKLPILFNQTDGKYYAYSRAFSKNPGPDGNKHFNMYLMSSTDGINFTQVTPIFSQSVIDETGDKLDGHIAIDYSVCPTKYYMALEGGGSMWASSSTNPFSPSSWSRPVPVVGYDLTGHKSASTGIFLIDGNSKYASWSVVDDGPLGMNKDHDTGIESTYSRAILANNLFSYLGSSGIGTVVLPAEQNTHCASSWDCNNRDKQDWKKEGNYYYLIYNGANYYRCVRFPGDSATVDWGNGIVRSANPLGGYDLRGVGKMQQSLNTTVCAVSYPVINTVAGELYMYYLYNNVPYDGGGRNLVARSKLVWNSLAGDYDGNNIVDLVDFGIWKSKYLAGTATLAEFGVWKSGFLGD